MKTAFIIYIRAVVLYLLITIPFLIAPVMYILSAFYVLLYGWFAWALFTIIYLLARRIKSFSSRMSVLWPAVIAAVAFALHILGLFNPDLDVWHSGGFLLFPVTAILAGWWSLGISANAIKSECEVTENVDTPDVSASIDHI